MIKQSMIKTTIAILTTSAILAGCTVANAQTTTTGTGDITYKENTVTKGDITVGINETATATINAVAHTFSSEGEVEEVLVKAGQSVSKGDPIATISVEDLEASLAKLQLSYNQAQVQLEQAKINQQLTAMDVQYEYTTNTNLGSTAERTYANTINELENSLETGKDDIDAAKEKYDYYAAKVASTGYYTDYNIEGLLAEVNAWKAEVTRIEKEIAEAQADAETLSNLQSELADAQKSLTSAQSAYNTNHEKYQSAFEKAETEMESLEKNIDSLRSTYSQTYNSAEATKTEAQYTLEESLEKSKNADSLYQIQLAQLDSEIKSQELSLQEAALEIAELKSSMGDTTIKAECDGIVMSVDVKAGDSIVANTTIATIADETEKYVMTSIAQEDISDIEIGKNAEIVFDAYPEETIEGVVDSITTTPARSSSSTVSYQVTVLLNSSDIKVYEGMTGSITFVAKQAKDVLYVSNRAVTTEDGIQYVKTKQEDGTLTKTEITTGFSDGRNCEVLTGLVEGDIVVIESVVSQK